MYTLLSAYTDHLNFVAIRPVVYTMAFTSDVDVDVDFNFFFRFLEIFDYPVFSFFFFFKKKRVLDDAPFT